MWVFLIEDEEIVPELAQEVNAIDDVPDDPKVARRSASTMGNAFYTRRCKLDTVPQGP